MSSIISWLFVAVNGAFIFLPKGLKIVQFFEFVSSKEYDFDPICLWNENSSRQPAKRQWIYTTFSFPKHVHKRHMSLLDLSLEYCAFYPRKPQVKVHLEKCGRETCQKRGGRRKWGRWCTQKICATFNMGLEMIKNRPFSFYENMA